MLTDAEFLDRLSRIKLIAFDFDGVFTDNAVWVFEDGREAVRCTRADGIGLSKLGPLGVQTAIISTEINPVVSARARKLKLDCVQACPDKKAAIRSMAQARGVPLAQILFMGNDVNDIPAFEEVGLAVAVSGSHPDVMPFVHWCGQVPGGHGAVREICDLLVRARHEAAA